MRKIIEYEFLKNSDVKESLIKPIKNKGERNENL
jgi:hypothetical protein